MTSLKPEEDYLDEDKPLKYMVKKQNFCTWAPHCRYRKKWTTERI